MNVHYRTFQWALDGLEQGWIKENEFNVAVYCACRVDFNTMRVSSYSAAQVCRFYGLDATYANKQRFNRALKNLEEATQYAVWDNYRKGKEAPYVVFLPRENPWIDRVSLCNPLSHLPVPADVSAGQSATNVDGESYKENAEKVSQPMSQQNRGGMSSNTQENQKIERESPLNPPSGDFSPAPLPLKGENAAAGQNRHRKTLDSKQCDLLHNAALLCSEFFRGLYQQKFSPNVIHLQALLRHYEPVELLNAQFNRFPSNSFSKQTMAHFFAKAAKDAIDAARLRGDSRVEHRDWLTFKRIAENDRKWKAVLDAYAKVFPNERSNEQTEFEASNNNNHQ